jgi:ribose transport system permease protein
MAVRVAPLTGSTDFLKRNSSIALSYMIALALFGVGTLLSIGFASAGNIRTILILGSFIGIVGLGQTLCILTGGIDLSIPQTLTGAAVLSSIVANGNASAMPRAILLVVALAIVVGLINGFGVAYIGIPPIIMTLGMNGAIQGLLLVRTNGGFSYAPPRALISFVLGSTFGIPTDLLIWAAVAIVGTVLLSWTTLGRTLYAIGTNRTAAYLAGIHVKRALMVPYVISAVGAALTGLLVMGYYGQAYLGMGDQYLFGSAAAVAVGGASILGGEGHYIGTIAGSLILTLVGAILGLLGLSAAWLGISYGVILFVTVFLASFRFDRSSFQIRPVDWLLRLRRSRR